MVNTENCAGGTSIVNQARQKYKEVFEHEKVPAERIKESCALRHGA